MKLAFIPSNGLGDGIIQTIIAQNLIGLGHQVDYFQDLICGLSSIFKDFDIEPTERLTISRLESYDWVIIDKGSKLVDDLLDQESICDRVVVYSMSKTLPDSSHANPHINNVVNTSDKHVLQAFNAKCLRRNKSLGSISEQIVHMFKAEFGLTHASKEVGLSIPDSWKKERFSSRVILHPTSSREAKNWTASGFLKLAKKLRSRGMEPIFSFAPSELNEWKSIIGDDHELLCHADLLDLAQAYYESAAFVGNDSGNGHLASLLGLPTVSIFSTRKKVFPWRPSWGSNVVIRPYISRRFAGKNLWKKTVPLHRIVATVIRLTEKN